MHHRDPRISFDNANIAQQFLGEVTMGCPGTAAPPPCPAPGLQDLLLEREVTAAVLRHARFWDGVAPLIILCVLLAWLYVWQQAPMPPSGSAESWAFLCLLFAVPMATWWMLPAFIRNAYRAARVTLREETPRLAELDRQITLLRIREDCLRRQYRG